MKFSNRIEHMIASPIRKLVPIADRIRAQGVEVIPLNIGQPDIPTPPDFLNAVRSYDVNVLEYANSRGITRTLETTQLYLHNYGLDFTLDELLITNGASEGLSFSLACTCDPGDAILVIEPFYTNYRSIAESQGVRLIPITTSVENHFRIPGIEAFNTVYEPSMRAVLLSSPSNPTGRVYTREEMEIIVAFVKKHDLFLLADEVYREFNYTDRPFYSFMQFDEIRNQVVLLDSISKKYSACGARIGSIATKNADFMANALKLAQSRLSVSTLDQIGAGAMDIVDDQYVEDNRITYKTRRNILQRRLEKLSGVVAPTPEGAFYNILRLPVEDAEDFILWTLHNIRIDNTTILLTPAESFYSTPGMGRNEVRISYCIDETKIERAMDILEKALREYPRRTTQKPADLHVENLPV